MRFFKALGFSVVLSSALMLSACTTIGDTRTYSNHEQNSSDSGFGNVLPSATSSDLKTRSDYTQNQNRAMAYMRLATEYYRQGQMETALDEIKKALKYDSKNPDIYLIRALIYMEMEEESHAENSFKQAMGLSPNNPEYENNYGLFLCRTQRIATAIPYFEKAVSNRRYRTPEKALNNAAECYLSVKNYTEAEKYLDRALDIDPTNPFTNATAAKFYYMRGDYAKGRTFIDKALRAGALTPEMLMTAIRIDRKVGDRASENAHAEQLRNNFPYSRESTAYTRGKID